jgi:hypothetical protein
MLLQAVNSLVITACCTGVLHHLIPHRWLLACYTQSKDVKTFSVNGACAGMAVKCAVARGLGWQVVVSQQICCLTGYTKE